MSKRIATILGAVAGLLIIGALYGLILRGIVQERKQQADLEMQIEPLEIAIASQQDSQTLPTRRAELATLQVEQAAVQSELVGARLTFPSEVDSTEVLSHIVDAATIHRANLRQLQARDPITTTVDELTYRVFAYDVTAEGELEALSAFLTALESGPVSTLSLDQVRFQTLPTPTPPPPTPDATPVATTEGPTVYQASLVVRVHVRLADSGTPPLGLAGTPVSPEERAQELETLLDQARQVEDWERAISLLLLLRQLRPDDPALEAQLIEAYVREGQRLLAAGQYDPAGADFRAALALQPDNAAALAGVMALTALTPPPPPTATFTPTPTATPTITPTPSNTPLPKPTSTPTVTPTPTATPLPYYVLHLSFASNTRYPDLGCTWFGFAGRVTDASGYPLQGITVHISAANWAGVKTTTTVSGEYEQFLDNHPRAERWLVQLHMGDTPVSDVSAVESRADCDAMVIQMDWRRNY